jgi:hypothetical protein
MDRVEHPQVPGIVDVTEQPRASEQVARFAEEVQRETAKEECHFDDVESEVASQ